MPLAGFEHETPASNWQQTLALDRLATEIGAAEDMFVITLLLQGMKNS
jgi:hypothetical protein